MHGLAVYSSSSIQTITVGPGVAPGQRTFSCPVADFTASGESRPALKTKYAVVFYAIVYDT